MKKNKQKKTPKNGVPKYVRKLHACLKTFIFKTLAELMQNCYWQVLFRYYIEKKILY